MYTGKPMGRYYSFVETHMAGTSERPKLFMEDLRASLPCLSRSSITATYSSRF